MRSVLSRYFYETGERTECWLIGLYTPVHPYLYAIINVAITFVSGYLLGFVFKSDPEKANNYSIYNRKTAK